MHKDCEIRQPLKLSEVCNSVVGGLDALEFPSEFLQHGGVLAQVVGDSAEHMRGWLYTTA